METEDFISEINSDMNPLYSIYDLSLIEILIINELVKLTRINNQNKVSILRHDLYKLINSLVQTHKTLSTSSFYRSLKKLQERGFLEFKKSDDVNYRKATEVYPTPMAANMLGFMIHFLVQFNQDIEVLSYIENNLQDELEKYILFSDLRKIRVVDPSVGRDSPDLITSILPNAIDIIQIMAMMIASRDTKSFSINVLSTEQIFEWDKNDLGTDLIVFPLYEKNSLFRGLTYLQIIDELVELLVSKGFMLIIYLESFEGKEHHYIDIFASFLNDSPFFQTYDSSTLRIQLKERGFDCLSNFSYRGVSFLLVQKL